MKGPLLFPHTGLGSEYAKRFPEVTLLRTEGIQIHHYFYLCIRTKPFPWGGDHYTLLITHTVVAVAEYLSTLSAYVLPHLPKSPVCFNKDLNV